MTASRALIVTHLFNHQTHHRGQVHAMVTAAGERTGNEFFAYPSLSPTLKASSLDPRTNAILCFVLCGFATLTSIAIQLASFLAWCRSAKPSKNSTGGGGSGGGQ